MSLSPNAAEFKPAHPVQEQQQNQQSQHQNRNNNSDGNSRGRNQYYKNNRPAQGRYSQQKQTFHKKSRSEVVKREATPQDKEEDYEDRHDIEAVLHQLEFERIQMEGNSKKANVSLNHLLNFRLPEREKAAVFKKTYTT